MASYDCSSRVAWRRRSSSTRLRSLMSSIMAMCCNGGSPGWQAAEMVRLTQTTQPSSGVAFFRGELANDTGTQPFHVVPGRGRIVGSVVC